MYGKDESMDVNNNREPTTRPEWIDILKTPFEGLFESAGVTSVTEAELFGEGMAFVWINWYLAQTKAVRKRNMLLLLEHLRLPAEARPQLARIVEEDETVAIRALRQFTIGYARAMWLEIVGETAGTGVDLSDLDWSKWSGPGTG